MVLVPFEWYELEKAPFVPKLDREQMMPVIFVSPEIGGRWYLATGEKIDAIEEIMIADIVFKCGSTCPTLFVHWNKKIFYANERKIWCPKFERS